MGEGDFRQLVFVIEVPKNPQDAFFQDAWKKSALMLDSLSSQGGNVLPQSCKHIA